MKLQKLVSLKLPADLIAVVERAAHAQERSPADLIRAALLAAFMPREGEADPGLAEYAVVQEAFQAAEGWLDLQTRLRAVGFVLRLREGTTLGLHAWPSNRHLIDVEALGQCLTALTLRFQAHFPGVMPRRARLADLTAPAVAAPRGTHRAAG
ncbi:CopG family transcriptional regulator [Phaeovulum sp. W22_SRMD_FR3]|uniref:ribbon-helix-helix domain-containing protein n=1 Tax=Phaeovulum sp. W22_SRMD_FR3 TaxID=3240274 RepID=UPI003F9A0399